MRDFAPIGIAAALFGVAVLIGFGIMNAGGGSGTSGPKPPQHTATGNYLACPGGGQVQSTYSQMGDKFSVTGSLASKEPNSLLVRGPTGYIRMTLADQSSIKGPYAAGEIVTVIGTIADGTTRANDVRPACAGAAVAAVTPAPTAPVSAVEPTSTTAPTPAPAPAVTPPPPPPAPAPDEPSFVTGTDDSGGRERNRDKHGRGHGRGGGGDD